MEQKKTLWIIAAVSIFLLVVLGGGCIIWGTATKSNASIASVSPVEKKAQQTPSGWTSPAADQVTPPAPVTANVSDLVVLSENTTVYTTPTDNSEGTTIDLNALKRDLAQETPVAAQPQNINITVNIPEPVKEPTTTYITSTPEYKPVEEKPAVTPVKVEKKVTKATETAKPAATKTTAPAPAAEPKKVTQFWVQVAAYSNKKGAEGARSVLDENKIPADIFTYKDSKDNLFYRVRIGPYTTKSEAEYWRSKIVKIDEFAKSESFVTSTTN